VDYDAVNELVDDGVGQLVNPHRCQMNSPFYWTVYMVESVMREKQCLYRALDCATLTLYIVFP
jgi:hypothetical protein